MPAQSARLSRLLGAPPHLATFEQVTGLVSQRAREDTDLDFKAANSYLTGGDSADELAKDVTAMANARGGLIVIGIEEDDQACAKALAPVTLSAKITEQLEQVLRSRVVPWLSGAEVRPVECPEAPGTGLYLVSIPRSPLAPHAVRSTGLSRAPVLLCAPRRYHYPVAGGNRDRRRLPRPVRARPGPHRAGPGILRRRPCPAHAPGQCDRHVA